MDNVNQIVSLGNGVNDFLSTAMQDPQDNPSGILQQPEGYDHGHFPELSSMDQCFGFNSSGKTPQAMVMDQSDSMNRFCTYEASAFKSTPRSNHLSGSPNLAVGTPNMNTPTDSMKIASGFVPKIRKNSPAFNSPSTTFATANPIKPTAGSAFSPPSQPYTSYAPHQPPPHVPGAPSDLGHFPLLPPLLPSPALLPHQEGYPTIPAQPIPTTHPAGITSEPSEPSQVPEGSESVAFEAKEDLEGSSDTPKDSKKPVEKGKKEKNRVSAQKCRMRKKQYVESLESQVQQLKDELAKCKQEIKIMKEKQEQAVLRGEHDPTVYKARHDDLRVKLHKSLVSQQPTPHVQELIQAIDTENGGGSIMRRMAVDALTEKVLEMAIPTSYKYLLWSASTGRSLFDAGYEKKKPKKNQKYLIYEEKKKIEQGLNDIWSVIEPEDWKKKTLSYMQPAFIKAKETLNEKVHIFLQAKNELLSEVTLLGKLIQAEIWPKFWATDIAQALLWINSKKHEAELSAVSLFGIQNPELVLQGGGSLVYK